MILPLFKRLYYTDFPSQFQSLVEQMSYSINSPFDSVFQALKNNLKFEDNFLATVKDVSVTVNASGTPTSTTSFSISNNNPISGTLIVKASNTTNTSIYPTSGIIISYTQNSSTITITNVAGLPANNAFTLRIVALQT